MGRLVAAVLLTVAMAVGTGTVSFARPSHQDLVDAKAKLAELNNRLSLLVEQYDQAKLDLDRSEKRLNDARTTAERAKAAADEARQKLDERARAAYEGTGSSLEVILGSASMADFNDRMAFLNNLAQQDADVAAQAEVRRQEYLRASKELATEVTKRETLLKSLDARKAEIQSGITEQQGLISRLAKELSKPVVQKLVNAPGPAPQPAGITGSGNGGGDNGGGGGGGPSPSPSPPPPPPPPPPPSSGAAAAVAAAYSALGTPYVWGGADLSGMDCSGLTMWSWAHAGVYLPHSSSAQYSAVPHVSFDQLQPGDLLFFYSPIHHVAIYVGGGQMIHETHPGTVAHVEGLTSYWMAYYVGAGRPG